MKKEHQTLAYIPVTTVPGRRRPNKQNRVRNLTFRTVRRTTVLLAAQEVKPVTANVCVEEKENPGVTALSGHVFSSAAAEALHPSEDIKAVVSQEADLQSAQRSKQLEHYLRLKRYKTAETSHSLPVPFHSKNHVFS